MGLPSKKEQDGFDWYEIIGCVFLIFVLFLAISLPIHKQLNATIGQLFIGSIIFSALAGILAFYEIRVRGKRLHE